MSFERTFAKELSHVLDMQYESAAKRLEAFNLNFESAVKDYIPELKTVYRNNLKRIMSNFGYRALAAIGYKETKSPYNDFLIYMNNYIVQYVALKVVDVTMTTIKTINHIIRIGNDNGWTNAEMAMKIRDVKEISKISRARTIARTETHSAAMNAFQGSMKTSGMIKEKEWISVNDSRTRTSPFNHAGADGERVGIDDMYFRTGQALRYPGDMENGSAANCVNCRCNQLFFTDKTINAA
jgi:hypothetical protein